jgi:hypothetical protein
MGYEPISGREEIAFPCEPLPFNDRERGVNLSTGRPTRRGMNLHCPSSFRTKAASIPRYLPTLFVDAPGCQNCNEMGAIESIFDLRPASISLTGLSETDETKISNLLKYRSLRTFQLTELQLRVLEAITPEKIADASLLELAKAFKILKEAELGLKGEPFRITGLPGYLMEIEREDERDRHASADEAFPE